MKFKFFSSFMLVIIFLSSQGYCQTFLEGQPTWSYQYFCGSFGPTEGYNNVRFVKDTIINNQLMKYFEEERIRTFFVGPGFDTTTNYQYFFMYEQGGKLIKNNTGNTGGAIIYDFSLEIGDTLLSVPSIFSDCSFDIHLIVDTIGNIEIDGFTLQYQDLIIPDPTYGIYFDKVRIIEKVGIVGHGYYNISASYDCGLDGCPFAYTFSCYENKPLNIYYYDNSNCTLSTTIENFDSPQIDLYPNPMAHNFKVKGIDGLKEIRIIDISGRELPIIKKDSDLMEFLAPRGIYFFQAIDKYDRFYSIKIIKE